MLKNHGMAWYLDLKRYLLSLVPHNRKNTIGCLQGEQKWGYRGEKRTEGEDNEEYGKEEERETPSSVWLGKDWRNVQKVVAYGMSLKDG